MRILAGDITPAAGLQAQPAVVDFDQQPIAVELTLERVLGGRQLVDRAEGGQHRRVILEARHRLLLHPVRQPLVAVGLNQRVAPRDSLPVEVDDHLPSLFSRVVELLRLVGPRIPDDHLAAAVLPLRDGALEGRVLQRVVLGVYSEVVDRGSVGQVLGHRPRHQHAVALKAEVVVQPPCVVLLDDEAVVVAGRSRPASDIGQRRGGFRHRLGRLRRIAHAAVGRQPVLPRHVGIEVGQQVAVLGHAGQHLGVIQLAQRGIADLVPRSRRGHRRVFPAAQRIRRDGGFRRVVLTPVQEHLAGPQALGHRGGDEFGHALLELLGHPPGQHRRPAAAHRVGQRGIQMQPLAPTGERVHRQPDVVHELAHRMGDLAQLRHGHTLAWIEVEHQTCCGTRLSGRRETPLRHVHLQRRLLRDPRQAGRAVDDRIRRAARAVHHRPAIQPVRSRTGKLLFEERRLLHTVGPAFPRDGPARDVRQHDLGHGGVVGEDVCLGGAGLGIEHLVGVGQRDAGSFRRTGGPHVIHHLNVLPAATLYQWRDGWWPAC